MLKKLVLLLSIPALFTIGGCGNTKKNTEDAAGMSTVDLTSYGAAVTINVPDTTKTKLEIVAQSSGAIDIKSGKDFQISIAPGEGDLPLKKSDVSSDEVIKFKRYVIDEPTSLIWESQVSGKESEFHFYLIVKSGKESFVVEDIKDGDVFNENAIKTMMETAKSLKSKSAEKS